MFTASKVMSFKHLFMFFLTFVDKNKRFFMAPSKRRHECMPLLGNVVIMSMLSLQKGDAVL